jgi:hypothetical protein
LPIRRPVERVEGQSDRCALLILQDYSSALRVLDLTFNTRSYAIAMLKHGPLVRILDELLLKQTESDW